ncbi:MAG: tetratricopeptide repeat protein [Myxococcales bacterium]|nr:tetratricopeptide repeat protein [Myxococcales bacterium]
MTGGDLSRRWQSLAPYLLALAVLLAYLPSLSGGFLNWDDPWLIRDNRVLADPSPSALGRIWRDFSPETRLELGAEYLPVRDTELWLEARLFGLSPGGLRASALALFDSVRSPSFALAPLVLLGLGLATAERAYVFASSERAFADATAKTRLSPTAPYQLASALEEGRDIPGALRLYELALVRSRGRDEVGRRATNNLAKLRVETGDLEGAEAVLAAGRLRWPDDPKIYANLVRVLSRQGRTTEARALFDELVLRFPEEARQSGARP